jgi:hypothetical protein
MTGTPKWLVNLPGRPPRATSPEQKISFVNATYYARYRHATQGGLRPQLPIAKFRCAAQTTRQIAAIEWFNANGRSRLRGSIALPGSEVNWHAFPGLGHRLATLASASTRGYC